LLNSADVFVIGSCLARIIGVPDGTSRRLIKPCSELPYAAAVHGGADHTVGLETDLLWQSVVTGISIQEMQLEKLGIRS